jgi:hypothetical protein
LPKASIATIPSVEAGARSMTFSMKFTGASLPKAQVRSATLPRLVGAIRHGRACAAAAVALTVCLVALTGCGGGGGEDSSTSASVLSEPQITTPDLGKPDRGSITTTPTNPGAGQANPNGQGVGPAGIQRVQEALAPFRDCLEQQGVSLQALRGSGGGPPGGQNSVQYRDQVEKAFTCIPKLPPQLRGRAEELKRRFEQRNG